MSLKESITYVKLIQPKEISTVLDSAALSYEDYPMFNYLVKGNSKATSIKQIVQSSIMASKVDYIGLSFGENDAAVAIFIKPNYKGTSRCRFFLGAD